jgi:lipoprotein-releasing system permease protein
MGYSLFIARRYIGAGRRSAFITAITLISVAGVAVGVLALIIVLSVLNGFEGEVISRIIGTSAHVVVRQPDGISDYRDVAARVSNVPRVEGVAPFVYSKAMVISRDATDALVVRGINLESERAVTDIADYIIPAGFTFEREDSGPPLIVIGRELAFSLRVAIGDTLMLARGDMDLDSPFGIMPSFEHFEVGGFFDSGMYDYDASFGLLSLRDAQKFSGMGDRVSGLTVRVRDMYDAPLMSNAISTILDGSYQVIDWIHLNRNLFTWMKMEKKVMFIILTLIIVVAAFNIASTLIMVVMQRTRDIGILKSMGAASRAVMRIFMLHGLIIGLIGTAVGVAAGIIVAHILDRYEILRVPGDVYFIETVPVKIQSGDVAAVAAVAVAVCFAATIYPAWQASRLLPVEAIRYE